MLEKITGQKIVCPWWLCFTFDNPLHTLNIAKKIGFSIKEIPRIKMSHSAILMSNK
jgi:hypothetical protein